MRMIFSLLCLLSLHHVYAQRTITGRILDAATQTAVEQVHVTMKASGKNSYSNKMGFFSFQIDAADTVVIFNRLGYDSTGIVVPKKDQFAVLVRKLYLTLPKLNLALVSTVLPPASDVDSTILDAQYPGGWKYFYNDLLRALRNDSIEKVVTDTVSYFLFTVDRKGMVAEMSVVPESPEFAAKVQKVIPTLQSWKPAMQNGFPVTQHFNLPLAWKPIGETFTRVEETAYPEGGMGAFYKEVFSIMKYPAYAKRMGISGKVFVEFIVNKDGSLTDVKVVRGIGAGCDEEAIRIVTESKVKWFPGTQRGNPVRQRMVLPISFDRSRK